GFLAGLVIDPLVLDAEPVEIALDPGDQVEIGVAAHGIEADQGRKNVFAALQVHLGVSVGSRIMHCGRGGSSFKLPRNTAGLICPRSNPSPPRRCSTSTASANCLRSRSRATSSTGSRS